MHVRVFIVNASDYNDGMGELNGKWISLPISEADLRDELSEIDVRCENIADGYILTDWQSPSYLGITRDTDVLRVSELLTANGNCATIVQAAH